MSHLFKKTEKNLVKTHHCDFGLDGSGHIDHIGRPWPLKVAIHQLIFSEFHDDCEHDFEPDYFWEEYPLHRYLRLPVRMLTSKFHRPRLKKGGKITIHLKFWQIHTT